MSWTETQANIPVEVVGPFVMNPGNTPLGLSVDSLSWEKTID